MPEFADRIDFFHSQFLIRQHQVTDTLTLQTLERALQVIYLVIQYRVFINMTTQQMLDDVSLPQTGTLILQLFIINVKIVLFFTPQAPFKRLHFRSRKQKSFQLRMLT
jgi:hypothetical protein